MNQVYEYEISMKVDTIESALNKVNKLEALPADENTLELARKNLKSVNSILEMGYFKGDDYKSLKFTQYVCVITIEKAKEFKHKKEILEG